MLLVAGVILMSLADLVLTLTYLTSTGMIEANPVARAIMRLGSPELLTVWKVLSVGVAAVILVGLRRTRAGEFGAWVCAGVLAWLSGQWMLYGREAEAMLRDPVAASQVQPETWVAMVPEGD